MKDTDSRELMELTFKVAGQTAGFLRDLTEIEGLGEVVGVQPLGDTTRRIDIVAEEYLVDLLKNEGINAVIVTEESGIIKIGLGSPEYLFIIDPLDGSSNYLSNIPWSAVSVAVATYGKCNSLDCVIAGTIAPIHTGMPISFAKGYGVFKGNSRVNPGMYSVKDMVLGYFDYGKGTKILDELLRSWSNVKVRSLGCASLEITYVALGYADAFIDVRGWLRNVDIVAAIGIAKELNAWVTNTRGECLNIPIDRIVKVGELLVARNKNVLKRILDITRKY